MSYQSRTRKLLVPVLATLMSVSPIVLAQDNGDDDGRRRRRGGDGQQRDGDRRGGGEGRGDGSGSRGGDGSGRGDNGGQQTGTDLNRRNSSSIGAINVNDRSWARDYRGELNYHLSDDRRMDQLDRSFKKLQRQVIKLTKAIDGKVKAHKVLTKAAKTLQSEINALNQAVVNAVTKKGQLNTKKTQVEATLPGLQSQLQLAQAAKRTTGQELKQATKRLTGMKEKLTAAETACTAAPTPKCQQQVATMKTKVTAQQTVVTQKTTLDNSASANVKVKRQAVGKANKRIEKIVADIAAIETANAARTVSLATKQTSLQAKKQQIATSAATINPQITQENQLLGQEKLLAADLSNYRDRLITRILEVNRGGAQDGRISGQDDGSDLARRMGEDHGHQDGNTDGERRGTVAGQERSYNSGLADGNRDGASRAQSEGQADGTRAGTRQGNIDAAKVEGADAGVNRAQNSDAASVGQGQGRDAGMDRATNTGLRNGTATGEAQAIKKYESINLSNLNLDGDFAGAFDRIVPGFPRGHRGNRFNPRPSRRIKREVVRHAYKDGYIARYRRAQRRVYTSNIDAIYNSVYDSSFERAFTEFSNRDYPGHRQSGYDNGESTTFGNMYPGIRDNFFGQFRRQFSANPDRNANEYQVTFRDVEASTYSRVYEDIRSANYERTEVDTFANNIAEQTEIFRKKRFAAVQSVYEGHPVLAFISADIADAGVNGVAAADGVFQPSEKTAHSVTLKNFGKKAATNVKIILDGKSVKVPSIAAQSSVKIKGIAVSQISSNGRIGSSESKTMKVFSPLTAEARIQGRHYDNISQGLINTETKTVRVRYPLALESLRPGSVVIVNEENSLNLKIDNTSTRSYTGPIKIDLVSNASGNVIVKGFSTVQKLGDNARLNDAKIKVASKQDIYTNLTFTARISKNGVTLGQATQMTVMAKAPYADQAGKPVVVVDSDRSSRELLDLLSKMGGINAVSVLDLSLTKRNASTLSKGLVEKTLLVLSDSRGTIMKTFNRTLEKSERTPMVVVSSSNGLEAITSAPAFANASSVGFSITGVQAEVPFVFANQILVKSLKGPQTAIKATMRNFKELLPLANVLKVSKDAMIDQVAAVGRDNFFAPSTAQSQLLQLFNVRTLGDILRVNRAYKKTDSDDVAEMIKDDKTMMHNKLSNSLGSVKEKNVALSLMAYDLSFITKNATRKWDPIADRMKLKIKNRLFGALFVKSAFKTIDKQYKKLKKFDKNLYKKITKNKGLHAPFTPVNEEDKRVGSNR